MAAPGGSSKSTAKLAIAAIIGAGVIQFVLQPIPSMAGADPSLQAATAADSSPTFSNLPADGPAAGSAPPLTYHSAQDATAKDNPESTLMSYLLLDGVKDASPLGFALRPDHRDLNSGESLAGLTIVSTDAGGPAARAGLLPYRNRLKQAIEFASIAGAFFFPPAMMLAPLIDASHAGDRYDMIVGVDGYRVRDALDFADSMRDAQPGQTIYLSIIRDGARAQLPVTLPELRVVQ